MSIKYTNEYYLKHKSQILANQRKYYLKHNYSNQKKYYLNHKVEIKLRNSDYIKEYHIKYNKAVVRAKTKENKLIIFSHYGNKCACCGESTYEFLAIDHINNNGAEHRRQLKRVGSSFYSWIIKNNFPDDLQILCHNCNLSKGFYGYCPHNKK